MRRRVGWKTTAMILFGILFFGVTTAHATVLGQINFQGMMTDDIGNPVPDGDYEMIFSIYAIPTGGTAIWSETQIVSTSDGIYSVVLGQPTNGIDPDDMDGNRYLGVKVAADSEMIPRQSLTAVPFSLKAADSETLGGRSAANFADASHSHDFGELSGDVPGDSITGRINVTHLVIGSEWSEAIKGTNSSSTIGAGVYGEASGTDAIGVAGGATGIDGIGIRGQTTGDNGIGIRGEATGSNGIGVYGTGPLWAGYFDGDIYVREIKSSTNGFSIYNQSGNMVFHTGWTGIFGDYTTINSGYAWGSDEPVSVVAGQLGVFFTKGDATGTPFAETLASIDTSGQFTCNVLQIMGGMDLAEPFDIKDTVAIKAGMLMVIDSENPGLLKAADQAYDTRVAGVVSGAGGIKPGMIMSQEGLTADGSKPIALSGRVYCLADASHGAIQPGDMLTSSDRKGYAMKASDRERAYGAVIGKAMTSLEKETGLVLILVSLQ